MNIELFKNHCWNILFLSNVTFSKFRWWFMKQNKICNWLCLYNCLVFHCLFWKQRLVVGLFCLFLWEGDRNEDKGNSRLTLVLPTLYLFRFGFNHISILNHSNPFTWTDSAGECTCSPSLRLDDRVGTLGHFQIGAERRQADHQAKVSLTLTVL